MPVRWYLLKTWVGREEELAEEIRRNVPSYLYKECFVIYQERIWRKQQRSIVHVEVLFPGCVFLTCEKAGAGGEHGVCEKMASLTEWMKRVSAVSRLAACGGLTILPMMDTDAEFLGKISGNDHLVKLSYVLKDEQGKIGRLSEPLSLCREQIERIQFKKRFAMVRQRLWGEEQVIVLGIVLKEDSGRELLREDGGNCPGIEFSAEEMVTG